MRSEEPRKAGTASATRVIAAATSTIWLFHALSAISGLVALPLVVSALGPVRYGIWVLIIQGISFLSLSDLGTANALGRVVARVRATGDPAAMSRVYSTTMALMTLSLGFVGLVVTLATPVVPGLLALGNEFRSEAIAVTLIMGWSMALQFPLIMGVGILTGHQQYGIHGTGKIFGSVANLAGVVLLARFHRLELIPLALVSAGSQLAGQVLLVIVAWRRTRPWNLSLRNISPAIAREVLDLGISTLVTSSGMLLRRSGLALAVGRLLGVGAAGLFGVALTVMNHLTPLVMSMSTPFATLSSEWRESGRHDLLRKAVNMGTMATFALATSAAAGLWVYGRSLLDLMFSRGAFSATEIELTSRLLTIMSCGAAAGLPQFVSVRTLQGVGKHWLVARNELMMSATSLVFGVALMAAGAGLHGAAAGWGVFWVLQGCVSYPFVMRDFLEQKISETLLKCYVPGAAVGAVVLALSWSTCRWFPPTSLVRLGAGIAFCGSAGLALLVAMSGRGGAILRRLRA